MKGTTQLPSKVQGKAILRADLRSFWVDHKACTRPKRTKNAGLPKNRKKWLHRIGTDNQFEWDPRGVKGVVRCSIELPVEGEMRLPKKGFHCKMDVSASRR